MGIFSGGNKKENQIMGHEGIFWKSTVHKLHIINGSHLLERYKEVQLKQWQILCFVLQKESKTFFFYSNRPEKQILF